MNWKTYFSTSVGRKLQMSFTGIFLILFLVVHCYVNAQVWFGKEAFLSAAHFMGTNVLIRTIEFGLFGFLLLHIIQGLSLAIRNRSKRSVRYAVSAGSQTSAWYRRSMGILGTLILLFLIVHLKNFWWPNRSTQLMTGEERNLYQDMYDHFANPWMVALYIGGCISLAWHLVHGFFSAFQTLGLTTHKYKKLINNVGIGFSIVVPFIFACMPVYFYLAHTGKIHLV